MNGVPEYVEPNTQPSPDGSWEPEEKTSIDAREDVQLSIKWHSKRPIVSGQFETAEQFWYAVHFCRSYGIPGCWKAKLVSNFGKFRLGGLYLIADFDLTERETNYHEYGERPYVSTE